MTFSPSSPELLSAADPLASRVRALGDELALLPARLSELMDAVGAAAVEAPTRLSIFHGYMAVLVASFVVALFATPIMRKLAIANGIVDRPSESRKVHRTPVAYLGGVAVFLGIMAGIMVSYLALAAPEGSIITFHTTQHLNPALLPAPVPISIILGMTIIMLCGLYDDVLGISPRVKIAGQLFAAAALAIEDVGVRLAGGVMEPIGVWIGNQDLTWTFELGGAIPYLAPGGEISFDLIYWSGAAIIAIFVLGACNASNLVDGLDGLLTGVTSIAMIGLLIVALSLALMDDGQRDAQRVVLCLAILGACLGFLPHNWNPASIFLGDAGSLLLGYCTIVVILTLGDTAKTNLVFAGLLIYSIPIIDTVLAIVRRKLAGKSLADADDQHLHHMLKRSLGVKGAVTALYAIGAGFATLGVVVSLSRARVSYALALLFASYITVLATKVARRAHMEAEMNRRMAHEAGRSGIGSGHAPGRPKPGADPASTPAGPSAPASDPDSPTEPAESAAVTNA